MKLNKLSKMINVHCDMIIYDNRNPMIIRFGEKPCRRFFYWKYLEKPSLLM